ncbi:MAG: Omp28-related outer membrane protein [Aequorivita sp.]
MKGITKLSVLLTLVLCFSCNKDDVSETIASSDLSLLKSENKVLRNQDIAFQLMDEETDITQSATFYVNDLAIDGNVFSSSVEGDFQVYAEYRGTGAVEKTQTDSFEVYIPRKKALIEGFTGTWCGNCPRVNFAVDKARDSIQDLVIVTFHAGNADPFTIPEEEVLFDFYDGFGVPRGFLDRGEEWTFKGENQYPLEEVAALAGFDTDISLSIYSNLLNNKLSVDVKVISENEISNSELVVFLLEDGLLYNQTNFWNDDPTNPAYNMGNPIVDFEHNHVLRMSITDVLGDIIPETSALTEYHRSFNVDIPSEFNPSNLKLVVTVLDEDNLVRNTQQASINQFQDYE